MAEDSVSPEWTFDLDLPGGEERSGADVRTRKGMEGGDEWSGDDGASRALGDGASGRSGAARTPQAEASAETRVRVMWGWNGTPAIGKRNLLELRGNRNGMRLG
jgi:hypothetical protein